MVTTSAKVWGPVYYLRVLLVLVLLVPVLVLVVQYQYYLVTDDGDDCVPWDSVFTQCIYLIMMGKSTTIALHDNYIDPLRCVRVASKPNRRQLHRFVCRHRSLAALLPVSTWFFL